ncbi:MAG TPA: KH domain-containing protein [Spirochaetota bacterium]|nr:KH domain-containing protein [Spirochaetota bacterium]HPS88170.1 KH domain-containing protein [Spirochaetota bacterium]
MNYSELVGYMVKSLVDHPEEVEIREIEGEKSTILELKVIKEDIGKVIGKHGRIARAIRTIINASATKSGKRVVLEILD